MICLIDALRLLFWEQPALRESTYLKRWLVRRMELDQSGSRGHLSVRGGEGIASMRQDRGVDLELLLWAVGRGIAG